MNNQTIPSNRLPDIARKIRRRIESSKRPLIISHIRLDGDALGAELGLAHILRERGTVSHIVNDSRIPQAYRFLPGVENVATSAEALRNDYDLAIVLDVPTWQRAKAIRNKLGPDLPIVSMDHHLKIERMGDMEWVDPAMSSVGEMIFHLARASGWPVSPEAATCLYVAIITDCGRFTFTNTTPSALRAAAGLIELGANHHLVTEMIYRRESPALLKLRAEVMQGLRLHANGRIALVILTQDMLKHHGVDSIDTHELADIPRCVDGVSVGVLLREMSDAGKVKASLRARNDFDVEAVARKFGGGGHRAAAGCELRGDLATVEKTIVAELAKGLDPAGMIGGRE